MATDAAPPKQILSGAELRRLLLLRERLRTAIVTASRRQRQEVLAAMELARQKRLGGRTVPWQAPEMAPSELLREIKWRLDISSLEEAGAAARALESGGRRTRGAR